MAKYTWDDFFNFSDETPLNKFGESIDGLKSIYAGFASAVEKSNERISESLGDYRTEAQKLLTVIEKQNVSMDRSSDEMNVAAKEANELFAATKQLKTMQEAHAKELDKLQREIDKLNKLRDESKKKTDAEKNSLDDLRKQLVEATNAYNKLGDAADNAIREDHLKKIRDLSAQYNAANKVVNEAKKSVVVAAQSYDKLSNDVAAARRELKSMENAFDTTNPRVKELTNFIQEGDKKLKAFDATLGQHQRNVGNYGAIVEDLQGAFASQFPQAAGGVSKLTGALSGATLGVGALVAGGAALGKMFYDESVRIKKAMETVNSLTNLTGKELENFTARASASSKVFEKEFNEVIRSGNVIMKSFGVGGTEAIETINQAMLRGVDIQGDFLEQINEYSTFVAQAGGTTQDLVDILLASEQAGVFSDKGLDTIKEATLRIREMTPATRDAIKGLGLSVEEIENGLRNGSTTVLEVIRKITNRMSELPPISREVGTAIADIFAGPGEDAGQFLFTLGEISKTQGDWTEQLTGSYKAQYELLQATQEYETVLMSTAGNFQAFSTNFETFWTKVKTVTIGILAELSTAFTTLDERVDNFKKSLANVKDLQVLNQEMDALKKQAEEGSTWWQYLSDGLLTAGNSVGMMNRQLERASETAAKMAAVQAQIDAVMADTTKSTEEQTKAVTMLADTYKKLRDAEFELQKFRLEEAIKAQEIIIKNEANGMSQRVAASVEAERLRNKLVALEREHDLFNAKDAKEKHKLIEEKSAAELAQIQRDAVAERVQISIDEMEFQASVWDKIAGDERNSLDRRVEAYSAAAEKRIQILDQELVNNLISFEDYSTEMEKIQRELFDTLATISETAFERTQDNTAKITAEALTELENELAAGNVTVAEYYRRRADIQGNGQRISLESQLDYLEKLSATLTAAGYDTTDIERQIAETRLALAENTNAELLAREEELQAQLVDLRNTAIDATLSIIESGFEREQMALDERLARLTEQRENELEMAGDNEAKKAEIIAKYAQEEERIKRQQAAAARKQAIFDKTAAIFTIGVNTAIAISKAVAAMPLTGGLPFSAIAAAMGALQIAAVLAKPIPQYAEGTEFHPGGLALVGEAGAEFVESPDGSMTYFDKPTVADFSRGTRVHNADDTRRMIESNMMATAANQYITDNDRIGGVVDTLVFDVDRIVDSVSSLEDTVKNKKEFHLNITRAGVSRMIADEKSWTEFYNQTYF